MNRPNRDIHGLRRFRPVETDQTASYEGIRHSHLTLGHGGRGGEGRGHGGCGGEGRGHAGAEVAADMEDPDAEGFLEDGGANGDGTAVRDGEGEMAATRTNLTTPPSCRPPNFRRQFRTPQVRLPCILTL